MHIEGLSLRGNAGWPTLEWAAVGQGLSAVYGPPRSGKTVLCEFLSHVLFGKQPVVTTPTYAGPCPEGQVRVESNGRRYQLRRRYSGATALQLTVSALDGSPVDHTTIRGLVGGLTPVVLSPLCAVDFAHTPELSRLLGSAFAAGFQSIAASQTANSRRAAELALRRDQLAQELETRLAGERRASKELDARWQELDRRVQHAQREAASCEDRLHGVETALAETDARLRYRRLELNADAGWRSGEDDLEHGLAELDGQIARTRTMLADLTERGAQLHARLNKTLAEGVSVAALAEQYRWLGIARQLSADLTGEISRLARASNSQQCVCRDAHPRLRPITEALHRQLDALQLLFDDERRAVEASDLQTELGHLQRAEVELRQHLELLLSRRQALAGGLRGSRLRAPHETSECAAALTWRQDSVSLRAADVQQLEERRLELEQARFQLVEQQRTYGRELRDLRAQRDTVARQRAALLSARSIEHVQRELADVQRKLAQAAEGEHDPEYLTRSLDCPTRASDYLAQLTDGRLTRLVLVDQGRRAQVGRGAGELLPVEALSAAQRDLVYVSMCLALLSATARQGIWLPLVLDEPFVRLDAHGTASLVSVLDAFCRQGHQVLLVTGQQAAIQRLSALGAALYDISDLQQHAPDPLVAPGAEAEQEVEASRRERPLKRRKSPRADSARRRKPSSIRPLNGKAAESDQTDAA